MEELIKKCTGCKKEFPATSDNFTKHKSGKYGLYAKCKSCKRLDQKEYREKNKEKISESRKEYYQKNKDKEDASNKKWRNNNKDRMRELSRKRYKKNKTYTTVATHNRRAKELGIPHTLTVDEMKKTLDYFDGSCAYCDVELNKDVFSDSYENVDHIMALSKGKYGTVKENCILCCQKCNLSKGSLTLAEWYLKQPFYTQERLLKIFEITSNGEGWVLNQ